MAIEQIVAYLAEHADKVPFILATRRSTDEGGQHAVRMNTSRMLEGLIMAAISGGIVMYGVQQKLDAEIADLRALVADMKAVQAQRDAAIALRVDKLDDRIIQHITDGKRK